MYVAGSILFLHLIFDNRFAIPISIVHIKFGCVAAIEIHTDMCVRSNGFRFFRIRNGYEFG